MKTAVFVKEFFEGPSGGWLGATLYQPSNLPLWMKGAADFGRFQVRSPRGEIDITLIIPKKVTPFEKVTSLYQVFSKMTGERALVLADELPRKSRGVLVRMRIPHVITDEAIYSPDLGLSYGKIQEPAPERTILEKLSPVGLKLTAAYLLQPSLFKDSPSLSELHERLKKVGYPVSVTSLSRTFQQLQELELVDSENLGPKKRMHFRDRKEVWERLAELPMETIIRRIEVHSPPSDKFESVLSGDSALGKLSDLMDPHHPTIAMSTRAYRKWEAQKSSLEKTSTDWSKAHTTIEIWSEDPLFLSEKGCLNPVELVLSLRAHTDERVQIALAQILNDHDLNPKHLKKGGQ